MKIYYKFLTLAFPALILFGCKDKLPVKDDLSGAKYDLLTQDSTRATFPANVKGKVVVLGLIFTHCPDICPLITNNMERIQQEAKKEDLSGVSFVSISFDPLRDKPSVLKEYADVREIDMKNWIFLTGRPGEIDSLKKQLHYVAIAGDTTYSETGEPSYFFVHTDRITLMDKEGKVRQEYKGSNVNVEEVMKDIKALAD
ncbi:MAG: SCO family protein [Ignavibacteria bacterium]|jgi:protein SCO1/2|nr:SCO family protein [Ignavibacteria bacterium]MCU7500474.1 SCO family protein [Ignavibacteria bacterium]MCU7513577.1 SCO family protein [Ignavibacteria bacterium]MCU7520973.1 SCO family protein [Ignavibacteria bacterium]MCU7525078.1 SCO family protein [Ignavibacteria bacterium]